MLDTLDRQVLVKNEIIFRNGDAGDCAYLIEDGQVEIFIETEVGEQRVGLIGKGELFGEIALIDHEPRTATARVVEKTILIPIPRQLVDNLLKKSDPILRHLLSVILERFRNSRSTDPLSKSRITEEHHSRMQQRIAVKGEATQKLSLAHDIKRALSRNEFQLYYQPICNLDDGKIAGYEALIRWNHPTNGLVMPMDFLWLAEQTGLMTELGLWTLEQACRDWPLLRKHTSVETPFVSVNFSASQLLGGFFANDVKEIVERNNMPPSELKMELTETVVVESPEMAMIILNKIIELGITLALDDYGTGYSSLDSLQKYPLATLKLDRGFIAPMLASEQSFAIVRSSIELAHSLGMKVVAEGIETQDVSDALLQLGCEYGQGWLFGKPVPLDKS